MADVTQTISGNSDSAQKAYADLAKQVVKLEDRLDRLTRGAASGSREMTNVNMGLADSFRNQITSLTTAYSGWQGLKAGIDAARQSLEDWHNTQREITNVQRTEAGGQAQLLKNLAGRSPAERQQVLDEVARIGREEKFPDRGALYGGAAEAISSSAGDTKLALAALRSGAKLNRHTPAELQELTGATIDIGRNIPGVSTDAVIGFMLKTLEESRVNNLQAGSRNIPSAIVSGINAAPQDAPARAAITGAAVFSALGTTAADVRGESTRTASEQLATHLRDFYTKTGTKNIRGREFPIPPPPDPGTYEGRIKGLQENEKLRKQFLEQYKFETRFSIPVEQLLTKGTLTAQTFEQAKKKIKFDATATQELANALNTATPELTGAAADANTQAALNERDLKDKQAAAATRTRSILEETRKRTNFVTKPPIGFNPLGRLGQLGFQLVGAYPTDKTAIELGTSAGEIFGRDPIGVGERLLQLRRGQILTGERSGIFGTGPLTAQGREHLAFVDQQIAILREMRDELRQQTKTLEALHDQGNKTEPGASAAAVAERGQQSER